MNRLPPVVVVLGATGAGKSKLALEIAQKFGGEIISADAMQMYKGLDIITNKVTAEEQKLAKHHMIDFLDPLLRSTVVDFRNQALPIIEDLRHRQVMPIICGGTNYYIESLMWNVLVEKAENTLEPVNKKFKSDYDQLDNREIYAKLQLIDPERAQELHQNERRKILRSLQVFHRQGKKHSQILAEQRESQGGGQLGGGLRFPQDQLAVLWVQSEQKILDERCDKRVDQMIAAGLLPELQDFHANYNQKRGPQNRDYTVGIFQSIGFKEFHDYLVLDPPERETSHGQALFAQGKNLMMLATRQYAKRQSKWIRQRFLRDGLRDCPPVYGVDSTDPSLWDAKVRQPAFQVVQAYIDGDISKLQPLPTSQSCSAEEANQMFECQICQISMKGRDVYKIHLEGKRHRKMAKSIKKKTE